MNTARLLYFVHGCTFLFSLGLLSIVPTVLNYTSRDATAGTIVHTHHSWMIRSFWWYVLWMTIVAVLFATFIGIPLGIVVWVVAWIWKAYRLLRGFINLDEDKPMPV